MSPGVFALAGMLVGALIFYCGYKAGKESGRNERDDKVLRDALARLDPEDKVGRLPSEMDDADLYASDDWPTQDIDDTDAGGKHYHPQEVPADWVPPAWLELRQSMGEAFA